MFLSSFTCIIFLVLALLCNLDAVSECNFEKYATGCFSQANFICDIDTNTCKCHPETPVLIEHRICVKRAKSNEICQFNQQCDNANGLQCAYSNDMLVHDAHLFDADLKDLKDPHPRCRRQGGGNIEPKARHKFKHQSYAQLQAQQQQYHSKYAQQNSHHHQTGSSSPRFVWIFLLACLLGLILLLLLVRTQCHKMNQSIHQQDDRLSINSELDIPPPYEIAIRMKL